MSKDDNPVNPKAETSDGTHEKRQAMGRRTVAPIVDTKTPEHARLLRIIRAKQDRDSKIRHFSTNLPSHVGDGDSVQDHLKEAINAALEENRATENTDIGLLDDYQIPEDEKKAVAIFNEQHPDLIEKLGLSKSPEKTRMASILNMSFLQPDAVREDIMYKVKEAYYEAGAELHRDLKDTYEYTTSYIGNTPRYSRVKEPNSGPDHDENIIKTAVKALNFLSMNTTRWINTTQRRALFELGGERTKDDYRPGFIVARELEKGTISIHQEDGSKKEASTVFLFNDLESGYLIETKSRNGATVVDIMKNGESLVKSTVINNAGQTKVSILMDSKKGTPEAAAELRAKASAIEDLKEGTFANLSEALTHVLPAFSTTSPAKAPDVPPAK